jgi:hypothetical protein
MAASQFSIGEKVFLNEDMPLHLCGRPYMTVPKGYACKIIDNVHLKVKATPCYDYALKEALFQQDWSSMPPRSSY